MSERLGHTPLAFTMRPQGGEHAPRPEPWQLGSKQRQRDAFAPTQEHETYMPTEISVCTGRQAKRAERAALERALRDCALDAAAL